MGYENQSTVTGFVESSKILRNVLDEMVFFLHAAIVLTCFQSEKSQKLDSMQSVLLERFTKLVKMNFKRE